MDSFRKNNLKPMDFWNRNKHVTYTKIPRFLRLFGLPGATTSCLSTLISALWFCWEVRGWNDVKPTHVFQVFCFSFFKGMGTSRHSCTFINLGFLYHCRMFCHFKRFLTAQVMILRGWAGSVESGKPCLTKDVDDAFLQVPIWAPCWDIQN